MRGASRRRAAAAAALLACCVSGAPAAVVRELRIYPAAPPASDASLAPGWLNFSWRGAYDLNSTAVAPFRGAACAQALPQLFGALSFFTSAPFEGPDAGERGWDAVDFWMRGRDALSVTVFVLPAGASAGGAAAASATARALTPVETLGRAAATLAVDTNPFAARGARPAAMVRAAMCDALLLSAHSLTPFVPHSRPARRPR